MEQRKRGAVDRRFDRSYRVTFVPQAAEAEAQRFDVPLDPSVGEDRTIRIEGPDRVLHALLPGPCFITVVDRAEDHCLDACARGQVDHGSQLRNPSRYRLSRVIKTLQGIDCDDAQVKLCAQSTYQRWVEAIEDAPVAKVIAHFHRIEVHLLGSLQELLQTGFRHGDTVQRSFHYVLQGFLICLMHTLACVGLYDCSFTL